MAHIIETIAHTSNRAILTDFDLCNQISGSAARRHALVKRALARQTIIRLRRGLYVPHQKYRRTPLNLYMIAQQIYGPSYISCESALAIHGWIPEAVPTIISAATKRTRSFTTPLGQFQYHHIPATPFLLGVARVGSDDGTYFLATPWRALTDYVYVNRRDWRGVHPLLHDLRIEMDSLSTTTREQLTALASAWKSRRVHRFLRGVRKDLNL